MNEKPLASVRDLIESLAGYVPALLAGAAVLVLGLLAAWICARILVRILVVMRLDRVIGRLGWGRALEKGDVRHSVFELAGTVFGAIVFLVFLDNAVTLWKLSVLSRLLERLVLLVPQLLTAAVVMLVGLGVGAAVSRSVHRALDEDGFLRARLAARLARSAVMALASAIALVQLGIAEGLVTGAFLIGFGALCLAFALAFGLGSRRAVEEMWEERLRRKKKEKEGGPGAAG
jgi:hypothetical protein